MKIIAESASNHQGKLPVLLGMAEAAAYAGADIFTVQVFRTDAFCEPEYERRDIVEEIEFSDAEWEQVFARCRELEIEVVPCPLDGPSLELVVAAGFKLIKIHATDILNLPLLEAIVAHDLRVLLETQAATARDIDIAVGALGRERIECLIHGFSNYPTEGEDLNLNALDHMQERWQLPVGFADHSLDTAGVPLMCLAKGCAYLEKHIAVSRNDRYYDWQVSLEKESFAIMVQEIRRYKKVLGKGIKHPVPSEVAFRNVLYKKYFPQEDGLKVYRSDRGLNFYEYKYREYAKEHVVGLLIARLKSHRLKEKVIRPLRNDALIFDLAARLGRSELTSKLMLATSWLDEDKRLIEEAEKRSLAAFAGDPLSVLDRMMDAAEQEKAGAVLRITGDNPLCDPDIIDAMIKLYLEHDLDYVRANNLPIGISAELYSVGYLQHLYQHIEDPNTSEYLSWFVMDIPGGRKGAIDVEYKGQQLWNYALTVDYEEDLERVLQLVGKINPAHFRDIGLADILAGVGAFKTIPPEAPVKLPKGMVVSFADFIERQRNMEYEIRETYHADKA
jgi:N,N'-diacetyllegionaminate synthase